MAKGQKRSNREAKKPKMKKPATAAPAVDFKGVSATSEPPSKKKG